MTDEIRHRVAWHGVAIAIALEIIATGLAMLVSAAGAWAVCAIFVVAAAVSSWKAAWVGAVTSIGASALLLTFLFGARAWPIMIFAGAAIILSTAIIVLSSRSRPAQPERVAASLASQRVTPLIPARPLIFEDVPLKRGSDTVTQVTPEARLDPQPSPQQEEARTVPAMEPEPLPDAEQEGIGASSEIEELAPTVEPLSAESPVEFAHDESKSSAIEEDRPALTPAEPSRPLPQVSDAEAVRLAEEAWARIQRHDEERLEAARRAAEDEARRAAEEARLHREAEEKQEAERLAAEVEALRMADEERDRAELEQQARLEMERHAAAAEALRIAEEERARARREEEERDRIRGEEEERARHRRAEDERFARELEEARMAAEEAAQRHIEKERLRAQREAEERQARELEEKRVAAHERRAAEQRTLQAPAQQRLVWESEKIREEHHGDRQEVIQPSVVSLPTQEDRRLEQTFSEADSVLRDDTPLAKVEATNGSEEGYTVVCFTCRASFQADDADWCSCLTTRRTLICTNCLTCFCKAPPAYAEAFWSQAPPSLLARRKAPAPRSPVARNPEPDEIVRPLVLSVEVDEEIQLIVQRVCINLGYGFIHAESGSDGLVLARRYRPNLILADDFLPDLDGREMCRSLKDEAIGDGVMVVMTGLYTDLACRTEALKRFRVDDYITKPVAITDLINLLERHLEGVRGLPRQEDLHQLHRALVDRPASSAAIGFDLTDLGSQESGGFSITELAGGSKPSTERYEISCFCGGSYDALVADWCAHAEPTIVCPRCGSCLCDAPASVRERFWLEAPPSLFERRIMLAKRRAISPENPSPDEVPRPVILLVEDDENVNLLVRTVATVLGIGIVVTTDGPDGLVLAMQYRPDLILVDALVPNLDGWQLCRLLKENPPTAAVKVVMMTGLHADRAREREAGPDMDDYIPKPLAVGDLILMIRKHLPQQTRPSM